MKLEPKQIVIVSGCPGSGKTTLSQALAKSLENGVHFRSDVFYEFPAALVDPTRPESHAQNTVIMRALARAARAFAEGGYPVLLDGVIGPWFLPVLREELAGGPPVAYVVLRVDLDEALRRVRERQGHGASATVQKMASEFADLGTLASHAVDTEGSTPSDVLEAVERGLAEGRFSLGWEKRA